MAGQLGPQAQSIVVQFTNGQTGEPLGPAISLPAATGRKEMEMIVNQLRRQLRAGRKLSEEEEEEGDEDLPFAFHVELNESTEEKKVKENMRLQITASITEDVLNAAAAKRLGLSAEDTLQVVFEPQAVFRVRPVSRCTSTLTGEYMLLHLYLAHY